MSMMHTRPLARWLALVVKEPARRLLLMLAGVVVLSNPMFPQSPAATRQSTEPSVSISDDDFSSLAQSIKTLDDPTFRAFLRARILSWLRPDGDKLRLQSVLLVASDGLADIKAREEEIGSVTAAWLRESLIRSTTRWDSSEANDLALKYRLRTHELAKTHPAVKLRSAVAKLDDPDNKKQANQALERALSKAEIRPTMLLGELLQMDRNRSPHLPQVLATVVSLEENQTGAFPLDFLNFLRSLYLRNTTPMGLQIRFLTACVKATRLSPEAFNDPMVRSPAIELLTATLPHLERMVPAQYAEAAGRLQELHSGSFNKFKDRQAAENRISKSDRPLDQLIAEADETNDKMFKRSLLERAAHLAQKAGKWRQAIDLMVSTDSDEDPGSECGIPSVVDEFLDEIVRSTLRAREMEISEYAASKMQCPIERSNALVGIAVRHYELGDTVRGKQTLAAAAKALGEAEDTIDKARSSLKLAGALQELDPQNAPAAFRNAVASINKVPLRNDGEEKQPTRQMLPLAEDVIKAFRLLARHDRGASLSISADIRLEELRTSATAGISSSALP